MPTTGMTRSFGQVVSDPGVDPRVRRALDRFSKPFLWVTNEGVYLDDQGRIALRLNGTTLSQTVDGLRLNPSGTPVIAGLTITGYSGFLKATNGVVAAVAGVETLTYSATQTGNTAATETDLFSYTIPANTLTTNGDSVDFVASGTYANTAATNKRIKVYLGAATVLDTGNLGLGSAAYDWTLRGTILRVGSTSQKCEAVLTTSIPANSIWTYTPQNYASASEDLTGTVQLRITGNATNANDVVGEFWKVIKHPA